MKTLGLMQNQWLHPANAHRFERACESYAGKPIYWKYREMVIRMALFAGCKSGRRLKMAFGEDVCEQIHWEEASPKVGTYASAVFPPDGEHIQNIINLIQPKIIIAFGKVALQGLQLVNYGDAKIIDTCHPANRSTQVMAMLRVAAIRLIDAKNLLQQQAIDA